MLSRLVNWLFTRTALGKALDTNKRYIGAGMVVLAAIVRVLGELAALFPEAAFLSVASKDLSDLLAKASEALAAVGLPVWAIGETHARAKEKADG